MAPFLRQAGGADRVFTLIAGEAWFIDAGAQTLGELSETPET